MTLREQLKNIVVHYDIETVQHTLAEVAKEAADPWYKAKVLAKGWESEMEEGTAGRTLVAYIRHLENIITTAEVKD